MSSKVQASSDPAQARDGFQSKWGFILACIGSAVGMGNIWRFPIMVHKYGGLTFLLPYFIFVILIGASGVIEEFALGRRAAAGPVGAFGMCTHERNGNRTTGEAIGAIPIIGSMMLAIGYTVVLGWIFKYTFMGITGGLYSLGTDMGAIGGAFGATAPEAATLGKRFPQWCRTVFSALATACGRLLHLWFRWLSWRLALQAALKKQTKS